MKKRPKTIAKWTVEELEDYVGGAIKELAETRGATYPIVMRLTAAEQEIALLNKIRLAESQKPPSWWRRIIRKMAKEI